MMPNKMKMTSAPLILILQVFLRLASTSVFLINRNPPGQPWLSRDSFRIPSSLCHRNNTNGECDLFKALGYKHQNCSCYCPSLNSSFVYHENKWTCLNNGKVRNLQDCRNTVFFYLEPKNSPGPLWSVNIGSEWYTDILFSEQAGSGWEHCEVHLSSSWYLGCNGSRLTSSQYLSKMKELFALHPRSTDGRPPRFTLWVNIHVPDAQMLKGKIINLGIQCSSPAQPQYHGCLMFKLSGQQTCDLPVPILRKSTLKPPRPTSTGKLSHTPSPSPSSSSLPASSTLVSPSPSPSQTNGKDNRVAIGAAVGGAIVLGTFIVIVIVIVVFWTRRKAGKNTEGTTKLGQSNETALYSSPDDYDDCIPGIPVYQMLRKGQSDAATYSSLDDYEDCTFYQSLHIDGIPVYQTLKKDQGVRTIALKKFAKSKPKHHSFTNLQSNDN